MQNSPRLDLRNSARALAVAVIFAAAFLAAMAVMPAFAAGNAKAVPAETQSGQAPMIVKIYPEDSEEDVPLDAKIMAIFNKKMRDEDINEFTVTLNDGVSDISTTVRYNQDLTKAVVTPLESLQPDHGYFVTVSRTIRDSGGMAMLSDKVWKFRTIKKADTNPPVIVDVSPTVSAPSVPTDAKIEVMFNKRMQDSSLNENTIVVKKGKDKVIGAIRYYPEANKVVFSPLNPLAPDALFEVTISSEICDASRNKLASGQTYTFKTARKISSKVTAAGASDRAEVETAAAEAVQGSKKGGSGSASTSKVLANPKIKKLMSRINKDGGDASADEDIVASGDDETPSKASAKAEIVEMFPAPGADMVSVDEKIVVKFNKKMNPATFNIFNFSVQDRAEYIFGKVEFDPKTNAATFTPSGNLKINRKYKITVSEKIEDAAGNQLGQNYYWDFTTMKEVATGSIKKTFDSPKAMGKDVTGPNVVSVMPRDNADNVPSSTQITAAFDEAIKDFSLNSFTFRLLNGETEVPGKLYYDTSQKKAIFTPKQSLEEGTAYNVQVTTGIMDLAGNYMQRERKWKFIVGKGWSGRSPMVTAVSPEKGADDVDLSAPIKVTFDRRMKAATITPYSFFVTDGTKSVQGKVSYDEQESSATFAPWSTYSSNRVYSVTLAKTIEDREGMALAETMVWQMKTGSGMQARVSSAGATSVSAGEDANMQIKVQKSMGSELIAQMGERTPAAAAAKSELGSEMNQARPEKTELKNLVPVAEMRDRMSVSDKGAYGRVTAKNYREDKLAPADEGKLLPPLAAEPAASPIDSAPDEMALRAGVSDKGAYGQPKMKRIKDTVDETSVADDAMNETLKDQIAKFLSDDAKASAKLGTQIDALPSNADPVADSRAAGIGNVDSVPGGDPAEFMADVKKAASRANADVSERVKAGIAANHDGKNIVYTKEDGLTKNTETANPKEAFVQMSDPPSKERSVNSPNPVGSRAVPRQPRLSDNDEDAPVKLEKAQKYGDPEELSPAADDEQGDPVKRALPDGGFAGPAQDGGGEGLIDSPIGEDIRASSAIKQPVQIAYNPDALSQASDAGAGLIPPAASSASAGAVQKQPASPQPQSQTAPAAGRNALMPAEPPTPKGMINGVPIEEIMKDGNLDLTIAEAPPAGQGAESPAAEAPAAAKPPASSSSADNAAKLRTYEPQLSDVGHIPSENDSRFLVIAIFPNKNAGGVKPDSTITAVFNKDIDVASLTGVTMQVYGAEGAVSGKLLYNQRMKKAIFRPNSPLARGVRYEVALTTAIKASSGQALMPLKWAFTTAQ